MAVLGAVYKAYCCSKVPYLCLRVNISLLKDSSICLAHVSDVISGGQGVWSGVGGISRVIVLGRWHS